MKFRTTDEAENYFWKHFAKHSEDYTGLDNWLDEQEIFEIDSEPVKRVLN